MSKPYLVITKSGNGYHCGCCRRTWEDHATHEFNDNTEALAYAKATDKSEDDVSVEAIYELAQPESIL